MGAGDINITPHADKPPFALQTQMQVSHYFTPYTNQTHSQYLWSHINQRKANHIQRALQKKF